ncbi:MAG: Spy/CpxP family protein refolding chaperone [Synechococcus sp.]
MKHLLFSSVLMGLSFVSTIVAPTQSAIAAEPQTQIDYSSPDSSSASLLPQDERQLVSQAMVVVTTDELAEALELTDDQRQELDSVLMTYEVELEKSAADFEETVVALSEVLVPTSSEAEIRAARQDMVYSAQELRDLLFNRLMDVREILTEEQRQKVHDLIEEMAADISQ